MSTSEDFGKSENSKKITIFRAQSFLGQAQVGLDDYYATSQKPIGSNWASKNGVLVGTGLSTAEINFLLPEVVDREPNDREFKAKVKEFYQDISTKVPYKEGAILEVGLSGSNDKPISDTNKPINLMEYLRYRHAMQHPWVAHSREESEGNQLKFYYIYDPEKKRTDTINLRETKEKAMEAYLILTKEKDERIDDVLAVLGEDPRGFKDKSEKLDYLHDKVNSTTVEEVSKFLKVATDKKIELQGFVNKLLHTGILKQVGSRYLVAETDKIVGDGIEDVLLELEDTEKNGQLITVFKSQLQEKMKAKVQRLTKPKGK